MTNCLLVYNVRTLLYLHRPHTEEPYKAGGAAHNIDLHTPCIYLSILTFSRRIKRYCLFGDMKLITFHIVPV